MDQFVATMLLWASYLSGYSIPPDVHPTVVYVPHQYFVENKCHNIDTPQHPCNYSGLYTFVDHTIHIDQTLERYRVEMILVHELTHFLQHVHNKYMGATCDYLLAREYEAYHVEQRYITEVQHSNKVVIPPTDSEICSN